MRKSRQKLAKPGEEKEEISRKLAGLWKRTEIQIEKNVFLVIWRLDGKNRTVYNVRRL